MKDTVEIGYVFKENCLGKGDVTRGAFFQDYWSKDQLTDSFVYGMLQSDFKKGS